MQAKRALGPVSGHHEANRRFYDDGHHVAYWARQTELLPVERLVFGRHIGPGMDVLDLGVGGGRTTPFLSERARRYVGVDYAQGMVDVCEARFPHLTFLCADAADLPMLDAQSFDAVVFSLGGIDYLTPPAKRRQALAEAHRLLRTGGLFICSRHNPRALVRLPGMPGQPNSPMGPLRTAVAVPVWAARRTVRMLPTRAFWTGEGMIEQPPGGFNSPVLPWSRARRAARGRAGVFTEMATPARVQRELDDAGFEVVAVHGTPYPRRARALWTNWYYYVAVRR
ncbi:MAG TPA: class I SAM-dependent methyltransferase [Acidimicrobiales bacterium]